MKKYSTPNLIKAVSLSAAMVTLLSSVSPVFAANFAFVGGNNNSTSGTSVSYIYGSHGSVVLAGDDNYCGADSVIGRGGKQQQAIKDTSRITAKQQYERFIGEKVFNGRSPYGTTTEQVTWVSEGILSNNGTYMGTNTFGTEDAMPEAYGVYSFATGCGSAATGNYSTVFGAGATAKAGGAQAFGVSALAGGIASVAMGVDSEASGKSAVAIGGLATALGENSVALGTRVRAEKNYAIAIGSEAEAQASGSIAIGSRRSDRTEEHDPNRKVIAKAENAIAIGTFAYAETEDSVAIGVNAQVFSKDGVAVGGGSISYREKGFAGYDPHLNAASTDSGIAWKSTTGAFSVGEVGVAPNGTEGKLTRQITGVAAGSEDTDAVNVAQLKAMRNVIAGGGAWQLSANDTDPTDVNSGNIVDFSVKNGDNEESKDNLKITKDNGGNNKNKINFTLSDDLKLMSVTTGKSSLDDSGLVITNGPSVKNEGISAGNKKITGVAEGSNDTDAVNYKQLKAMEALAGAWKLSVDGSNTTDVKAGSTVDLIAGETRGTQSKNIKIQKDHNNKVTFALSDQITLTTVVTGNSIMSNDGFKFLNGNGPSITVNGISAGDKKITGVVAGTDDTDAVNYSQLKEIKNQIAGGGAWQLSANDTDPTDVNSGNIVDFSVKNGDNEESKDNLKITKDNGGNNKNKINFTLSDDLKLTSVTTGESIMDAVGFRFTGDDGPSITVTGIHAGNKTIKGVADAEDDFDAVNYKQLKDVKTLSEKGWKLSVNGANPVDVKAGSTVDFVGVIAEEGNEESKNIKITKGSDNTVQFGLNDIIRVKRVIADKTNVSDDGFIITGGPNMTTGGIFAGNKKITGVAAGKGDTDAVNYKQLKDFTAKIKTGWKLAVENEEATDIGAESTVKFVAAADKDSHKNINIVRGDDNEVKFDLNKFIKVNTIKVGDEVTITDNGLVIKRGPSITYGGIDASNKEIRNVAEGILDTDAVNLTQLKKVEEKIQEVAGNNLVKWDEDQNLITIGKEKGGMKIDITGSDGDRTIAGVKAGTISANSTEAINGSQINTISGNIAKYFGGGAKFENGDFVGPKYSLSVIVEDGTVAKVNYRDVGTALNGLDANIKSVNTRITNVANDFSQKIDGLSKDALLWSEDEQAFVARHEKNGKKTNSKLKFLLDGNIAEGSTDAITGNQLYLMSTQLAAYFGGGAGYKDGKWTDPTFKIVQVNADGTTVEKEHHNVADAFGDVNKNMSNINNRIDDVINKVDSDALKWNNDKKAYDASRDGKPNKIINVADGKVEEGSKDAVNGGQLWKTNERVTGVEKDVKHLTDRVDNISTTVTDIGKTVFHIENKVDNIDNRINDIAEDAVRYDRDKNGKKANKVTLKGGDASEPVLIDNVADGRIEKGSKEAVNGGQLHDYTEQQMKIILDQSKNYTDQRVNNIVVDAIDDAVERANHYTNMRFEALNYNIENVRKEARRAAAIGLAVSNLRYNDTPGKLSVAFGSGLWRSQSAFAFGAGYTSEKGNIRSNVSVTSSGGHWGVGAGLNMTLN
ncbi:Vomp family autotransporter [Bartonella sp. 220]|uniref:Vomp family autotransporter n=1 Tax=Bartonella sp. 220B TaxID=2967260 RepID=UPI0022A9BB4F|nr:Vomp family autotransporter [Bartonella sp. 220B]MCZ2157681.1 Vomp family autotransporter [Bartonella sp. 220B]